MQRLYMIILFTFKKLWRALCMRSASSKVGLDMLDTTLNDENIISSEHLVLSQCCDIINVLFNVL